MRFLYKIHSAYDGFTPARIPGRLINGKSMSLRWAKYIDVVERGAEVWIYFRGPHRFQDGVYAKTVVERLDLANHLVDVRVREYSTSEPLTDLGTSARVAQAVATWYQQVFVFPEDLDAAPVCDAMTTAESCRQRFCGECRAWRALPLVRQASLNEPARLGRNVAAYVPAYWVVPPRSFVLREERMIKPGVRRTTDLFYMFKTGRKNLAFVFALAIFTRLASAGLLEIDAVVPIPLSPDKASAGELHRTLHLARELGRMLTAPVSECLHLSRPISKRWLRGALGYSAAQFEDAYRRALVVTRAPVGTLLLVDDTCTEGSTLRVASAALATAEPIGRIVAATAAQMAVKAVVTDVNALLV